MNATIKIKVNRIYFERFEAPCGESEVIEIRLEWERAVIQIIEEAGFNTKIDLGIGHDPAIQCFIFVDISDECDCENPEPKCDCEAQAEIPEIRKLLDSCGKWISEYAIEAGYDAAKRQSDIFVKESKST